MTACTDVSAAVSARAAMRSLQERVRERVAALGPVEHERAHARGVLDAEWGGGDGCHAPRIPPQTASSACGVGSKR